MINLLNKMTLEAVKTAYLNNDEMTLNCLGLKIDEAKSLAKLTPNEIDYIFSNQINCVQINVDSQTLKKSIEGFHRKKEYDAQTHEAILLGATRDIMYRYARLSHNQFTQLRKQLNVSSSRAILLSDGEMSALEKALNIKAITDKKEITIAYLVELAKASNLTICSIYAYLLENWSHKHEFK